MSCQVMYQSYYPYFNPYHHPPSTATSAVTSSPPASSPSSGVVNLQTQPLEPSPPMQRSSHTPPSPTSHSKSVSNKHLRVTQIKIGRPFQQCQNSIFCTFLQKRGKFQTKTFAQILFLKRQNVNLVQFQQVKFLVWSQLGHQNWGIFH